MEGSTPKARIKRAFAGLVSHVLLGKRDEKVILVTKGRSARARCFEWVPGTLGACKGADYARDGSEG
jgi:hypothetical protein